MVCCVATGTGDSCLQLLPLDGRFTGVAERGGSGEGGSGAVVCCNEVTAEVVIVFDPLQARVWFSLTIPLRRD